MIRDQFSLCMDNEIIVDLFAGGGGMSCAIEMALGRHSDVSVNHNDDAVSMHAINHPQTQHYRADVFEVCPHEATSGRPVGLLHLSPDCTHHSQAAGGQPRDVKIRALAWVGKRWAGQVLPRVITLENVKQILQWGPLVAKRCKKTGRVVTLQMIKCPTTGRMVNRVAAPGERVPVNEQYLIPDKKHAGRTWKRFVTDLRALGYVVEWRVLNAADYGAATTRERLFMCARRDGKPIAWPEPTHFKEPKKGQRRWRPAADHIDWSMPCPSIFGRKKPLADATMRRIAKGMDKFVLNNASPFIVPIANWSGESVQDAGDPLRTITAWPKGGHFAVAAPTLMPLTHQGADRVYDPKDPARTITAAHRGEIALAAATMVQLGYGERTNQEPRALDIEKPLGTVVAGGGKHGLVSAFLAQANGGFNTTVGRDLDEPATTLTATGSQQQLVAATLAHLRGNCDARDPVDPLMTVSAGGQHHGIIAASLQRQFGNSVGQKVDEPVGTIMTGGGGKTALVEYTLSKEQHAGALRCASFLISYYGTDNMRGLDEPAATFTTRDRLALVTVWIKGEPWVIVDIGLRMLTPRELYNCQGFPPDYIIDHGHDGRKFTKSAQVRMVGNSVSPPPAMALIKANCMDMASWTIGELRQRERIAA